MRTEMPWMEAKSHRMRIGPTALALAIVGVSIGGAIKIVRAEDASAARTNSAHSLVTQDPEKQEAEQKQAGKDDEATRKQLDEMVKQRETLDSKIRSLRSKLGRRDTVTREYRFATPFSDTGKATPEQRKQAEEAMKMAQEAMRMAQKAMADAQRSLGGFNFGGEGHVFVMPPIPPMPNMPKFNFKNFPETRIWMNGKEMQGKDFEKFQKEFEGEWKKKQPEFEKQMREFEQRMEKWQKELELKMRSREKSKNDSKGNAEESDKEEADDEKETSKKGGISIHSSDENIKVIPASHTRRSGKDAL